MASVYIFYDFKSELGLSTKPKKSAACCLVIIIAPCSAHIAIEPLKLTTSIDAVPIGSNMGTAKSWCVSFIF